MWNSIDIAAEVQNFSDTMTSSMIKVKQEIEHMKNATFKIRGSMSSWDKEHVTLNDIREELENLQKELALVHNDITSNSENIQEAKEGDDMDSRFEVVAVVDTHTILVSFPSPRSALPSLDLLF